MTNKSAAMALVRASKNRKVYARVSPDRVLAILLGHLIRYQSTERPWSWLAPGRLEWEETYRADALGVPRPAAGETTLDLTCPTCGSAVTLRVRSRSAIAFYFLALACLVALSGLVCYMLCRDAGWAGCGAIAAFYVLTIRELLGMEDHHSAVRIIKQSRPGHQVWLPGEE